MKHKYLSESDDEDKQKPKEKTKGMGKGKGYGKKSTKGGKSGGCKTSRSQDTFSISSSQGSQALQAESYKVQSSIQGAQGQSGHTSPYGPQVPDDYEAEIFKNEVPTVVLYHKSFQVCYPSSSRQQWNPWYMRAPHNMLF